MDMRDIKQIQRFTANGAFKIQSFFNHLAYPCTNTALAAAARHRLSLAAHTVHRHTSRGCPASALCWPGICAGHATLPPHPDLLGGIIRPWCGPILSVVSAAGHPAADGRRYPGIPPAASIAAVDVRAAPSAGADAGHPHVSRPDPAGLRRAGASRRRSATAYAEALPRTLCRASATQLCDLLPTALPESQTRTEFVPD